MSRHPLRKRTADADREIGARVRAARLAANISQEALAAGLGITFQQIQKYETGTNRIGVGTLVEIAKILGHSVESLIQGLGDTAPREAPLIDRQAARLARVFYRLPAPDKAGVVAFVDAVAARSLAPAG